MGLKAQSKLLGGLNRFYTATKTRAVEWAQKNPLLTPKEYVATPERQVFKLANNSVNKWNKQKNGLDSVKEN